MRVCSRMFSVCLFVSRVSVVHKGPIANFTANGTALFPVSSVLQFSSIVRVVEFRKGTGSQVEVISKGE